LSKLRTASSQYFSPRYRVAFAGDERVQ